jgi:DNA-directed RNA polymerase omega subunit
MIFKIPKQFDSKFRFIVVAAERAKQIQNGAPRRLELDSPKAAYVAIREVEKTLVPFEVLEEEDTEEE